MEAKKSRRQELQEKYRKKVEELDAEMEELKKQPFDDDMYHKMMHVMCETNRYLRHLGASEEEMYDI